MTSNKLKLMSVLLIWMTLLLGTTPAMGQSARLNKGQVAPYKGVLISEDYYRMMTVDIEHGERIKQEYSEFAIREERKENSLTAFFLGGSVVGGALVYLLTGAGR